MPGPPDEGNQAGAGLEALGLSALDVLESVTDAFFFLDRDWRFVYLNAQAEAVLGLSRSAGIGGTIWELFPAAVGSEFERQYRGAMQTGQRASFSAYYPPPLNAWYDVTAYPSEKGLAVYFRDVTESRKAEEMLRATTDAVPALIAFLDRDLVYRFCNRGYEEFFGLSPGSIVGRFIGDVIGEAAFAVAGPNFRRALGGEPVTYASWISYAGAGRKYVRASYRPRLDEAGEVQGVYAMVVDETELKLAEEQLAERDQRHRATFEGASVGIAQVSTEGRILDLNDAACGIFGYAREELLQMSVGEVSYPEDLEQDFAMATRVLLGEIGRYRMEKRLLRKDGAVAWVDLGVSLVRSADGEPLYFVSTFEDITARKAAEQALRASEAKWRFFATLSDALRGADSLERIASEACRLVAEELGVERCTYTSVDVESDKGTTIAEFRRGVPSLLGEHRMSDYGPEVWERSARGETVANRNVGEDPNTKGQAAAYAAIGTRAFVHAPLLRDGKLLGFLDVHATEPRDWSEQEVETVRDVASRLWEAAQRSAAEEALRGSESRLRLALETAQLGTWDHEVATGITHYSEAVGPMLGRAREPISLSPERLLPYVHPDDREMVAVAIQANLERGETYFARMRVIGEDGVVRWVESRGDLERDAQGRPQRVRGVAVDVTEQVEAERALRESNERLEQAVSERTEQLVRSNRDLDQFAYSVAHDLRAPLRNIVSTSRMLLEDAGGRLTVEEADLLRRQAASALRLAKIVDDLLGFARLADAEPKRELFDMTALARRTAAEVLARRGGCVVKVREGMRAVGDASLIGYVLTNLLDNACKFSPGGATVSVGEEGGAFFVRDQGQGFNMAHVGKLFVAFERLVGQEVEGTGVGLANVRRIVEKHGGRVWAESAGEGKGATFWFTLG